MNLSDKTPKRRCSFTFVLNHFHQNTALLGLQESEIAGSWHKKKSVSGKKPREDYFPLSHPDLILRYRRPAISAESQISKQLTFTECVCSFRSV